MESTDESMVPPSAGTPDESLLVRHRWLPFVLPLAVYMVAQTFEPSAPELPAAIAENDSISAEAKEKILRDIDGVVRFEHYPLVYTAKLAVTILTLIYVWPAYREFKFRVSWLALAVGAVGIVVWVGLCSLELEPKLLSLVGLEGWLGLGDRAAYNPLDQLKDHPLWGYAFLAVRFAGLVVVVPIIEEMFYRAFLMRVVMAEQWWAIPFGTVNRTAVAVGIFFPALAHPGELIAAIAWFGMVTWLMTRTKNIWDCVAAHAMTNLLLGIYVLAFGQWHLW